MPNPYPEDEEDVDSGSAGLYLGVGILSGIFGSNRKPVYKASFGPYSPVTTNVSSVPGANGSQDALHPTHVSDTQTFIEKAVDKTFASGGMALQALKYLKIVNPELGAVGAAAEVVP